LNDAASKAGNFSVENVEESVIRNLGRFANCSICPLSAFFGGLIA
jgi:hypothetical protein